MKSGGFLKKTGGKKMHFLSQGVNNFFENRLIDIEIG